MDSLLGVKVDKVTMNEVIAKVFEWIEGGGKHYIVTPNIEIIMAAQKDPKYKEILNSADLSIPDSSRFNWVRVELKEKNTLKRIIFWPFFLFPFIKQVSYFDVVTGTDLMDRLLNEKYQKIVRVGFVGGQKSLAESLRERLNKFNKNVKVVFADSKIDVDMEGYTVDSLDNIPSMDILFVGLGHIKQEKFINNYKDKISAKVFISVGGAIDYLSRAVPRAPLFLRYLGLEWLYRLIIQPWRIKRFGALINFVFLVLLKSSKS